MTKDELIQQMEICAGTVNGKCPKDCPMRQVDYCTVLIIKDALELLKEQEPRVLTLEEAFKLQDTPYLGSLFAEIKEREDIFLCLINDKIYGDYHSDDIKVYRWNSSSRIYSKTEYGKNIRFWNLYPTVEQRKAVEWDD